MNEAIINSSAGDGWTLLQFVTQEALQWGKADLLALGPDLAFNRIGELATYFGAFAAGGSRNVEAVWVILPPVHAISQDTSVEAFRKSFVAAMTEISKGQVSQAIIEERFASLFPIIVANFDGDALTELLKTAPARTAIIVADARQFRLAATSLPEGDRLDEDEWSAHVHQLLREVDVLCHDGDRYVVLDLGSHPPSRSQNFELLKSVGDTGFYSSNGPNPDADEIVARISRWIIAAKARDIGSVLKEVDADAGLSDRQRFFIKLEIYSTGRLNDQVRILLSDNAAMLENLPVDQALNIARVCEIADDDDRAEALVAAALPSIRAERDFAYALEVAENTGRRDLARAVASAFQKFHPNAPMMGRIAILEAVRAGDYARAAALLAASSDPAGTQRARYYELLAQQTGRLEWNPEKALNAIVTTLPDLSAEAAIEISRALEREHRRLDSLSFMLALGNDLGSTGLLNLIRLSSLAIQAGDLSSADEKIEQLIDLCVAHLSAHPNDGMVRTRLASLLAPNVTASDGLAHLVFAVMKRAKALPRIRQKPKVSDRPLPVDPDDLTPRLERIWRWLREKGDGVLLLGLHPLPAEELDLPPDRVLAAILRAVDHIGDKLVDDVDYHVMTLFVAAASAVAPLSVEPDEDLTVLRTAAAKLVIAGKGQAARDLAEHALTIAGDRPERRRQALFTFSDVYARLGMKAEALVALSAAFEASSDATWDQIWFESNLLFRLLRDANMSELGFDLLKRSRQALGELGLADRDGYRIETMELQARLALFGRQGGEDAEVASLLELAQKNAEAVHAQRDDLMPIAMMLNTLVGIAKSRQLTIVAPAEELVGRLIPSLSGPRQQMVRAVGPAPSLADIAAVAANIDEARYADDTGYDLRHLRIMARGLVGEAVASVDPKKLTYAIEASADRSMSIKDGGGTKAPVERLLAREDAPEAAAAQLSMLGVAVVCMALFDDKLATIEFEKGQLSDVTLEEPPIFSTAALHKWSERFPWDYKLEEKWLSGDDVRESVAHIGLTKLPDRSVMVADAQLQRFPPSLFTIEGNYAGYSHAIGVAPSLEWLTASRKLDRQGDGSARMWIPISSDVPHNAVLKLLADQVEPLLAREGIALERDDQPSPDFAKADVAIIGGHGGLAEANRFFRSVADEEHGITGISEMGDLTRHSRLAILFVCSGGRIDPHPETGMAIGLAKQLVARGCSAVIAPAWPIPFFMARPWLEGFLAEWRKGSLLLDAYYAANQAVGTSTSWDPKRTFAMSLYGDPFIKAS